MNLKASKMLKNLLALLFWVAVWQGLALVIGKPLLLPAPFQVLGRLFEMMLEAEFWIFTSISLLRVLVGLLSATALGIALAVLCCKSPLAEALFAPLLTVIKSTPVASFVILVLIWIDRDYVPVLISALMVLPVIWANVRTGIKETDRELIELSKLYRLPRSRVLKRIYIPSVMPYFRSACASALGFGWKAGIAAEVLTVPKMSIGRMIYESKLYLQTTDLFAWTLALILLSLVLEKLLLHPVRRRHEDDKA